MPANDPTPEEVEAATKQVWNQVVTLASTRKGRLLMEAAREIYPDHEG